jgi:hypothetical protein
MNINLTIVNRYHYWRTDFIAIELFLPNGIPPLAKHLNTYCDFLNKSLTFRIHLLFSDQICIWYPFSELQEHRNAINPLAYIFKIFTTYTGSQSLLTIQLIILLVDLKTRYRSETLEPMIFDKGLIFPNELFRTFSRLLVCNNFFF